MKKLKFLSIILLVVVTITCKKNASRSNSYNESESFYNEETEEAYPDDTYCADVDYYNPDTGTRSSYSLNVDVENNEVTKIHFSSGWLDSSEFSSEALDRDGYCSITSYDRRQFNIQITGSECSYTDEAKLRNDTQEDEEASTCPSCGGEKDEYDTYCNSCTDKRENTCSRCGGFEYYVYEGLCSSCKSDDERQEEEEENY